MVLPCIFFAEGQNKKDSSSTVVWPCCRDEQVKKKKKKNLEKYCHAFNPLLPLCGPKKQNFKFFFYRHSNQVPQLVIMEVVLCAFLNFSFSFLHLLH